MAFAATPATRPRPEGCATCSICGGPARHGWAQCFCCRRLVAALRRPAPPVLTVTRFALGDPVHRTLRRYKDAPAAEARRYFRERLTELLDGFLECHGRCLVAATGGFDAVAVVPSTRAGSGAPISVPGASVPDPFAAVVDNVRALGSLPRVTLSRRGSLAAGRGSPPTGPDSPTTWRRSRLEVDPRFLRVASAPGPDGQPGLRVLVADDTWTTGASALEAAAALASSSGRFRVTGILVAGRSVDPGAGRDVAAWWAACGAESGTHRCRSTGAG